jgi:hypothetical protein
MVKGALGGAGKGQARGVVAHPRNQALLDDRPHVPDSAGASKVVPAKSALLAGKDLPAEPLVIKVDAGSDHAQATKLRHKNRAPSTSLYERSFQQLGPFY